MLKTEVSSRGASAGRVPEAKHGSQGAYETDAELASRREPLSGSHNAKLIPFCFAAA